jgi:hypothetical protein
MALRHARIGERWSGIGGQIAVDDVYEDVEDLA